MRTVRSFVVLLLALGACAVEPSEPPPLMPAIVDHVVDGDTAWFEFDGRTEKVRFIGVDTPESTNRHEPYGKEASAFTASILTKGRGVFLELDADQRDRYGRTLGYVWLEEPTTRDRAEISSKMLNGMLVAQGFANVLTVPPNVAYADVFVILQREARDAGRGLWGLR